MPRNAAWLNGVVSRKQLISRKRAEAEQRRRTSRRRQAARSVAIGGGIAALLVAALVVFWPGPAPTGATAPEAWDLPLLADSEQRVTLAEFGGKPTVAAFFANWCPHCRRELPGFAELSAQIGDVVNFVGINSQNNGRGLGFAREMGIDSWILARDVGGSDGRGLSTAFGAQGMPLTVIYSPDGVVTEIIRGPISAPNLLDLLRQNFDI